MRFGCEIARSVLSCAFLMESFEKRKRERRKQELRKEKALRKQQGVEPAGPSQEDYFADPNSSPGTSEDEKGDTTPADPDGPAHPTGSAASPDPA